MHLIFDLQDHENKSHQGSQIDFHDEGTIPWLKEKLCKRFHIPEENIQITDKNGCRIDLLVGSVADAGVLTMDTLIVTHSMSKNWEEFVACSELAQQALESNRMSEVERNVELAMNQLKPLNESNFLVTFPGLFGPLYRQFTNSFWQYIYQEMKPIELAAFLYFSKIFNDNAECPELEVKCRKTFPNGIQGRLICQVSRCETVLANYYVKERNYCLSHYQHADLREIFVYKLFELIKVGPEVHFIPGSRHSRIGMFIGVKEVNGFSRADGDELEMSNEIHAQHDLLRRLLNLRDIHPRNYGIDNQNRFVYIEFQVKNNVPDSSRVHRYLDENYAKSWKGSSKEHRIQVAKECIESWDLPDSFDKANAAIVNQKELFKKNSMPHKKKENFDEYFLQIKNNLNALLLHCSI